MEVLVYVEVGVAVYVEVYVSVTVKVDETVYVYEGVKDNVSVKVGA